MKWTRNMTELFKKELTPRASQLIDLLASTPGKRYSVSELVEELGLDAAGVVNGLLGETTKAIKLAGFHSDEPHSWFVEWKQDPHFSYWLGQEKSDWWINHTSRKFWSLTCNPRTGYDIYCALDRVELDWWTTKKAKIRVGDRVAIWKTLGGSKFPKNYGIVAFGEVIDGPKIRGDVGNPCWKTGLESSLEEERVAVRYFQLPNGPLWINGSADAILKDLNAYRAHGGTAFSVSITQFESILREAGGWPTVIKTKVGMNRKKFIESHGATCRNWNWSWSFINEKEKFIIFGVWDRYTEGNTAVILKEEWRTNDKGRKLAGYNQSREHIRLIEEEGYQLKTFTMIYSDDNKDEEGIGPAKIEGFIPKLTNRTLFRIGKEWRGVDGVPGNQMPEEDNSEQYVEGAVKTVTVNTYERNPEALAKCIEHYGCECAVCAFNFETYYGSIGKDYIHVHHIVSLSEIKQEYTLDPLKDLIPVCPNCHAILHRTRPALTIDQLREHLANQGDS